MEKFVIAAKTKSRIIIKKVIYLRAYNIGNL